MCWPTVIRLARCAPQSGLDFHPGPCGERPGANLCANADNPRSSSRVGQTPEEDSGRLKQHIDVGVVRPVI